MPRLLVTTCEGETQEFQAQQGVSVMAAIRAAGVDELLALGGGSCSCATCHVYVDQGFLVQLAPIRNDEDELLDFSNHRAGNSRLSCQVSLTSALDGLHVTIAPED